MKRKALAVAAVLGAAALAAAMWFRTSAMSGAARNSDDPAAEQPRLSGGKPTAPHVPGSKLYSPRRRFDRISVAGAPEPVRVAPGSHLSVSSGKPSIVEEQAPRPSDEELRADQQRRKLLRDQGIDTPNPRRERPNAPADPRPGHRADP